METKPLLKLDLRRSGIDPQAGTLAREAQAALRLLHGGGGAGSDFRGWVDLPLRTTEAEIAEIVRVAAALRGRAEAIVSVGIGGSYLGARAVLEALGPGFGELRRPGDPVLLFAGQNLSERYMAELLRVLRGRDFAVIAISKSGTTTEPAIALRILRAELERRYGRQGAAERIVAVTDRSRGALRELAEREGYATFTIPDDVGGRYSVLTPVGLLPLAAAGIDIAALVEGARRMALATGPEVPCGENPALQYAAVRNGLYRNGYKIELLATYEPRLHYVAEWWKQLYGESEGKDGKGIFPASVSYTADLHSMGQYIQQGERILFETVVSVAAEEDEVRIDSGGDGADGLDFLGGKRLGEVNRTAELGVALAHADGGVPNLRIEMERLDALHVGALLYFFEKACGVSGYMAGINPFDQPGVEAYKRNMFALLDKPGYEAEGEVLRARLAAERE